MKGNVDKVVIVIKDKDQVALERFIFSVENMIQVEAFNKDTRYSFSCLGEADPIIYARAMAALKKL